MQQLQEQKRIKPFSALRNILVLNMAVLRRYLFLLGSNKTIHKLQNCNPPKCANICTMYQYFLAIFTTNFKFIKESTLP